MAFSNKKSLGKIDKNWRMGGIYTSTVLKVFLRMVLKRYLQKKVIFLILKYIRACRSRKGDGSREYLAKILQKATKTMTILRPVRVNVWDNLFSKSSNRLFGFNVGESVVKIAISVVN